MAHGAQLFITIGKGGVRSVEMFLKQSYIRQIKGTNYPFGWVGRNFTICKQNREVVIKYNDSSVP